MLNVATTELMRALDERMINETGISGCVLMEDAAHAVSSAVISAYNEKLKNKNGKTVIMIGQGNNGGDGLAVLRLLRSAGKNAVGLLLADEKRFAGDAKLNYDIAAKLGLSMLSDISALNDADVIVDAVFGTGLSREITGKAAQAIALANSLNAYRIAVDIPSGLDGNSGRVHGCVFNADETITFVAIKRGLLLTTALESVGSITVAPVGMLDGEAEALLEKEQLIDRAFVASLLPERKRVTNKGSFGRALIVGGSEGMYGAAVMASSAALRAGAGLTRAYVPEGALGAFSAVPEVMVCTDEGENANDIAALSDWATAIGIGCGMGGDKNKKAKLRAVLRSEKPAVIDADGLNSLDEELVGLLNRRHVLTPHPGEMARLAGCKTSDVLADPVGMASEFASRHNVTVLLKNAVTVIASPDGRLRYNASGNTGLAKGGSGDTLTGIITAFIAAGMDVFDAASAGAYLLGCSADVALELLKTRALAAGDVIEAVENTINDLL